MNPDPARLRQKQLEEAELSARSRSQTALQFSSPEEMLRLDASQTKPPGSIAERLKESIAGEPRGFRSWWRRLFRKST
jgi:hypothetical protein